MCWSLQVLRLRRRRRLFDCRFMTLATFDDISREFAAALHACRELYVGAAHQCLEQCPHLVPGSPESYIELLDNLHRGLLFKVFAAVATSDRSLVPAEQMLATQL